VSHETAQTITDDVCIPTVGIGAGAYCDGQVLVSSDMLGQYESVPSYVRKFAHLYKATVAAGKQYGEEVKRSNFPGS
jgi:3-methyl-2-oxobutanoate hydroxymethyltransferase